MSRPLLSICIPTYNRADVLNECLESIVCQYKKDGSIIERVEVVISDNCSTDDTKEMVNRYCGYFTNIKYFRNAKNIGMVGNMIKVTTYARGRYIWFFSDDDKHGEGSLTTVLDAVDRYKTDALFCNTKTFSSADGITVANNFKISDDLILAGKKELFDFISHHYYCNDFFFTFFSNYIVKKDIFTSDMGLVEKYDSPLDLYPFHVPIYYSKTDFSFVILSKPIVMYRCDNVSWGPKSDKFEHEIFTYKLMNYHYNNILKINYQYISFTLVDRVLFNRLKRRMVIFLLIHRDNKIVGLFYKFLKFLK